MARNIFEEDPDDIIIDMAKVEGDGWLLAQLGGWYDLTPDIDFYPSVERLKEIRAEDPDSTCSAGVYGSGGGNRWCIDGNGNVVFLHSFCGMYKERTLELVRSLGFSVRW